MPATAGTLQAAPCPSRRAHGPQSKHGRVLTGPIAWKEPPCPLSTPLPGPEAVAVNNFTLQTKINIPLGPASPNPLSSSFVKAKATSALDNFDPFLFSFSSLLQILSIQIRQNA